MKIVVVGAGGHARSVCDVLLQMGVHEIVGLVDPADKGGFFDIPLLGDDNLLESIFRQKKAQGAFVAMGSNNARKRLIHQLSEFGYEIVQAISPHAIVSSYASIGRGTVVMAGAIINACAKIGEGCIINTNASIDHDDAIGDYCHIAPGATICGFVSVGSGSFIGAGATIIDRISVGEDVMLGAGSVAIHDIPSNRTAVGVPAKIIKEVKLEAKHL